MREANDRHNVDRKASSQISASVRQRGLPLSASGWNPGLFSTKLNARPLGIVLSSMLVTIIDAQLKAAIHSCDSSTVGRHATIVE